MGRIRSRIALLVLAQMLPGAVSAEPASTELAAAEEAERRGAEIYAYDQAAWHATDRFQDDIRRRGIDLQVLSKRGLGGYVVEPGEGGSLLVTFYGEQQGRRFALARYVVSGSTVTGGGFIEPDGPSALSLLAERMIDGRKAAIEAMAKPDHGLCSGSPPNTVVLPPRADGKLPVYVLTSTTAAGSYPAGGHYRFEFGAAGELLAERRFSNSCFNLDFATKDGEKPTAFFLTHLLDPQPTEIHAFVSRNLPMPLMVATLSNRAIWQVGEGRIRYVADVPSEE